MIKVLYVLAGDMSFDEMLFLDSFINQLPAAGMENHILTPALPVAHINLQNRHVDITQAKPGFEYEEWRELIDSFEPQIVILCDPYIMLSEDAPDLTYIELAWLEDLPCVVAVMDFRANVLKTPDEQLALASYILDGETPPYTLDYDFLIKICPPHDAVETQNPKLFQWGCQDQMGGLAIYNERDAVRKQLSCPPEAMLVTLVFPWEAALMAQERGLIDHFVVVVETLIHYLNQLPGEYLLSVVNMPPPFEDYEFENVHVRFFKTLDQHLLNGLFCATQLLITESMSYPGLALSASREIPSLVIGASVGLDAQGQLQHALGELSPFLQLKLDTLRDENPDALFPYISFPSRLRSAWPQTELFRERFLYHLVDIFNEPRTVQLMQELLHGGPAQDTFKQTLQDYRQRKLDLTTDAEKIIRKLVTAPPRHLC